MPLSRWAPGPAPKRGGGVVGGGVRGMWGLRSSSTFFSHNMARTNFSFSRHQQFSYRKK